MSETLDNSEVSELVAQLKKFPYLVSIITGGTVTGTTITGGTTTDLNPLANAPSVEPDTETTDVTLYETEAEVQARYLTKNDLTITITTRAVDTALALQKKIKRGDNVLASTAEYIMTLVPITSETEKTVIFAHTFLQPGLSFTPGENGDPSTISLTFTAKADATTGLAFDFA